MIAIRGDMRVMYPDKSGRSKANPEFPQSLGGRPYLDRITFRGVPDATIRMTELVTGSGTRYL